jgi:hypothetical protein
VSVRDVTAAPGPDRSQAFSPRTILALVAVGLVSFSGLAVLAAYAPELRTGGDPGAHALSSSAVGFKGAVIMLQAEGAPTVVSRATPKKNSADLLILTPQMDTTEQNLEPFALQSRKLIVLPKWTVAAQPLHPGFVNKLGVWENSQAATALLNRYAKTTEMLRRTGVSRPVLRGDPSFGADAVLPLGDVDRLQTVAPGGEWDPMLSDEQGDIVLGRSRTQDGVYLLADPDLLNNQGLANLDNARAGMAIINTLRAGQGVSFDVTLNGFTRGRGIGRLVLEPPWLAATLCGVAAALLMGLHGLARFGPTLTRGRAIALGKRALVDNSAGLVRMARREPELAPAYATLTRSLIRRYVGAGDRAATGGENDRWLADLASQRGAAAPDDLTREAERAQTRDDLLAIGRKLYLWRLEITRERR